MSELTQVISSLAVITGEMRHVRADLTGLRRDVETLQQNARSEILQLRGDLAVHDAEKNEVLAGALKAIAEEKKRPNAWPVTSRSLLWPSRP